MATAMNTSKATAMNTSKAKGKQFRVKMLENSDQFWKILW